MHFHLCEIWRIFCIMLDMEIQLATPVCQTLNSLETQYNFIQLHRSNTNSSTSPFFSLIILLWSDSHSEVEKHSSSQDTEEQNIKSLFALTFHMPCLCQLQAHVCRKFLLTSVSTAVAMPCFVWLLDITTKTQANTEYTSRISGIQFSLPHWQIFSYHVCISRSSPFA